MRSTICVGYAKCGTTLLDEAVRATDGIVAPVTEKEIKFFLPRNFPGQHCKDRYYSHFYSNEVDVFPTFEASPQYMHQEPAVFFDVLMNIRVTVENPIIVVCVRHPVLRAYSHYVHNLQEFALYGEGVFNKRLDLIRKGCCRSFEEALIETRRLMTRYAEGISAVIEVFGRDRLRLFFLETDPPVLGDWMVNNLQVSSQHREDLNKMGSGSPVFSRRPIPNYHIEGSDVVAYGVSPQQIVRYANLSKDEIEKVKCGQKRWTTHLESQEIERMAKQYFYDDLKECADITSDTRFLGYLSNPVQSVISKLSEESVLQRVHNSCVGAKDN